MGATHEDLDRLLENAGWARALGVELVGAGEADDLVQDAWVVALEGSGGARNPAAWLSGVLRKLASRRRRGSERRARREGRAARHEAQPAADELVAEAEIQRELIRLVTELEEPYRTTVLLRFYRGWTPEEIARSQGVPGATARTRLHRALARLRERLDREHGGREAWALAFTVPASIGDTGMITAATFKGATVKGATVKGATVKGGGLVGAKALFTGAAVIAVLAGYAIWRGPDGSEGGSTRDEQGVAFSDAGTPVPLEPASELSTGSSSRRESVATDPGAAAAFDEVLLYGSVEDENGRLVDLEFVSAEDRSGNLRTDSGSGPGSFALAGLAPGPYVLRARAKGFLSRREELALRGDAPHQRHDLVLSAALVIPVKLVDEDGALLEDPTPHPNLPWLDVVATRTKPADGLCGLHRNTGALYGCGEFETERGKTELPAGYSGLLRLMAPPPLFVSVILKDAVLVTRRIDGPVPELVFSIERARLAAELGGLRVRFVDALSGSPVPAGEVGLDPPSVFSNGGLALDEHGSALLEGRAPGLYSLRFFHRDYAELQRSVRVPAGRVADLGDVRVWARATIRGTILDARGAPAIATIHWSPLADLQGPADVVPRTRQRSPGGSFELENVPRGPVRLLVELSGHALLARTVDASSGLVEGLVLRLEEGVRVALRAPEAAVGREATLADEGGMPLTTWRLFDGVHETRLVPGRYQLWTGWAERVDSIEVLVVGNEPVERTVGGEKP